MRLLRYLQRGARDLGLSMKELGEGLEGIRPGRVSRGGMPGSGGKPEWVLEEMNRTPAGFVSTFRPVEMVPSRKTN